MAKKNKNKYKESWLPGEKESSVKLSRENLRNIKKERKPVSKSFEAKYDGPECPKCFQRISKGDRVRYVSTDDSTLVHARHEVREVAYVICNSCFLAKPCECED